MKNKKNLLSKREKLFCLYYANSADAQQSAKDAGFSKEPLKKALTLLSRTEIADEISAYLKTRERISSIQACCGYEKLAFSSVSDALSLLYMDSPTKEELERLNLFMVSEIKRPKDGALEIKFFDRLKALEKLSTMHREDRENSGGLIDALCLGAKNLSEQTGDEFEV